MNTLFRISVLLVSLLLLIVSGPAMAQRTGDGIVPAIEDVCNDDPFSFGLCNAYCEALDCESETPLGTPRACSNILENYMKKSGGSAPDCDPVVEVSCPCAFDSGQDFINLINAAQGYEPPFTPQIDEQTLTTQCNTIGGEPSVTYLVTQASNGASTPQGLKLFNWVEVSEESSTCAAVGGGFDGNTAPAAPGGLWSYGPFPIPNEEPSLNAEEVAACQAALLQLCPLE